MGAHSADWSASIRQTPYFCVVPSECTTSCLHRCIFAVL